MPTFRKRGSSWRVEVRRKGITQSATFSTKAKAEAWAAKIEAEIADGHAKEIPAKKFGDLLERYRDEVSVTKRGERWERLRIGLLLRDTLAAVSLRALDATHVSDWRDRRLKDVSGASVRREWNLLSNACNIAIREWHWLKFNPFKDVRRPPPPRHREEIYTQDEIDRLTVAMTLNPVLDMGRAMIAFLFAIETGMRAGEICALTPDTINGSVAKVTGVTHGAGKTAAAVRDVPLSPEALRLLGLLPPTLFDLTPKRLDALFRKGKERALIVGKTFHDSRHTAITRLAKKLDVLALARMVGHKDLRQLMIYYNESAADMAKRL